jgi:hypothetical protein
VFLRIRIPVATIGGSDKALRLALRACLAALTALNDLYLRANPRTPALYGSGVRYQTEAPGRDDWDVIPLVLKRGWGDCEDLAAWRCAELRAAGVAAVCDARRTGPETWHAFVRLPDGTVDDPSLRLGMRRRTTGGIGWARR